MISESLVIEPPKDVDDPKIIVNVVIPVEMDSNLEPFLVFLNGDDLTEINRAFFPNHVHFPLLFHGTFVASDVTKTSTNSPKTTDFTTKYDDGSSSKTIKVLTALFMACFL